MTPHGRAGFEGDDALHGSSFIVGANTLIPDPSPIEGEGSAPLSLDGRGVRGEGAAPPLEGKPQHAPGAIRRARTLRRKSTFAERLLWDALRERKLRVRRQAAERTAWLETQGYRVLRLAESAVRNDLYTLVDRIAADLSPSFPTLPPSRGKGE